MRFASCSIFGTVHVLQIKDRFIPTEGYVQFELKFISNNSIEGIYLPFSNSKTRVLIKMLQNK